MSIRMRYRANGDLRRRFIKEVDGELVAEYKSNRSAATQTVLPVACARETVCAVLVPSPNSRSGGVSHVWFVNRIYPSRVEIFSVLVEEAINT
jgi:hypothetical protein